MLSEGNGIHGIMVEVVLCRPCSPSYSKVHRDYAHSYIMLEVVFVLIALTLTLKIVCEFISRV